SRRAPVDYALAGDRPAGRAGHSRRLAARLHSLCRRLSDSRSAGRRTNCNGGQPGAEPVHEFARLAVWLGRIDRVDGDCDRWYSAAAAESKRGPSMSRWLSVWSAALFAFLHLPLLTLAVFSFNRSRFT